jgi:hypothetical protein
MASPGEDVQKTIQELSPRITEILSIYKPLVLRLKQMVKAGVDDEGEILLDVLNQFLRKELTAEALTTFWGKFDEKAAQAAEQPKYKILAERLNRGELIPFLGPEIHCLSEVSLVTSRELAQKLAEQAEYKDFRGPLSMISQYYQMTEYGRGTLLRTIQEAIAPKSVTPATNLFYKCLVNIQHPILIISASYDSLLENLFIQNQKPFVVISHLRTENEVGKVLLKYAEKPGPEATMMAEEVSKLNILENDYSIIYKVCGCFGLRQESSSTKPVSEPRMTQREKELQQNWDLLSKKLSGLERAYVLETDPEEKFRLEHRIAEIKAEREQVGQELSEIEARLSPQSSSRSYQIGESQSRLLDSVLISEDDYFAFAKRIESVIPAYLAKQFSQKSLLFLGHNLSEWQDRLVLNAILEKRRTRSERSYAVQETPTAYETAYWKFHGVDLYQVSLKTFVEKLGESIT